MKHIRLALRKVRYGFPACRQRRFNAPAASWLTQSAGKKEVSGAVAQTIQVGVFDWRELRFDRFQLFAQLLYVVSGRPQCGVGLGQRGTRHLMPLFDTFVTPHFGC